MNVMLDLETMGTAADAPIIAIGAVAFDRERVKDFFYVNVDLQSAIAAGGVVSPETVAWWEKQSEAARAALKVDVRHVDVALDNFSSWYAHVCTEYGCAEPAVWGNGAGFDNVILAATYARSGKTAPWKFWQDRCYRTMKAMYPGVPFSRKGTHHNALDDARSQAEHLIQIFRSVDF